MQKLALLSFMLIPLAACGPVSVDRAERLCLEDARRAAGPTGEVTIGGGSGGRHAGIELGISSHWITGRDPSAVYETCVMAKSGEAPRRPLTQRSDWKG